MRAVARHQPMDAYTLSDRRRARLALVILFVALCERASEPTAADREAEPPRVVQASIDEHRG